MLIAERLKLLMDLTSGGLGLYNPDMPGIERSGVTPEELVWDLENSIRSSRENKYAVQVGLKDQDFKLDKERIQTLCLTVPFRSIDQAEQALVDNLIYPTQCMEESYKTLTTRQ